MSKLRDIVNKIVGPALPKQTDTACVHPWEWYSIDTGFGMYRICPRHHYQPIESGKINFNNHKPLQELRKALVKGEKHPGCKDCWESEAAGGKSYRNVMNSARWPTAGVPIIKKKVAKHVEIKFSNLCNIRCLTCHPICSSLWEEKIGMPDEAKQLMNLEANPKETEEQFLKWIKDNYNDIEVIQLFGGEPVLHDSFYPLLELILDAPKGSKGKHISYSTNGNWPKVYKDKHYEYVQRLLDQKNTLFVRFSVDGVGKQGEYIRDNLDWPRFENNFKEYYETFYHHDTMQHSNARMRCNVALSILNVLYLDTICQWLDKNTPGVTPHYNFVSKPSKFYMYNWGKKLKIIKELIARQDYKQYKEYQNHVMGMCDNYAKLDPNEKEIKDLKAFLDEYDAGKGVNHLELFPLNKILFQGIEGITIPKDTMPAKIVYSDVKRQEIEENIPGSLRQVNGAYFDSRGRETDENGVKRKDPVTGKNRW